MTIKTLLTTLSLATLFGSAAPAAAGGFGPPARGQRMERMRQHLGLSDEQVARVRALRTEHRQQVDSTRQQLHALRRQLRAVLSAPVVDEGQAMTLFQQMEPYRRLARETRFKHRLQVLRVMTLEQRRKLVQSHAGRRWGKGRRGHRGHGGEDAAMPR